MRWPHQAIHKREDHRLRQGAETARWLRFTGWCQLSSSLIPAIGRFVLPAASRSAYWIVTHSSTHWYHLYILRAFPHDPLVDTVFSTFQDWPFQDAGTLRVKAPSTSLQNQTRNEIIQNCWFLNLPAQEKNNWAIHSPPSVHRCSLREPKSARRATSASKSQQNRPHLGSHGWILQSPYDVHCLGESLEIEIAFFRNCPCFQC